MPSFIVLLGWKGTQSDLDFTYLTFFANHGLERDSVERLTKPRQVNVFVSCFGAAGSLNWSGRRRRLVVAVAVVVGC